MEQNNGDADGAIAEENGDAEVTHVQKRKRLNFSQKLALAILGTFMGIVLTSSIVYTCLFLIVFKNIFKLENMILVFSGFLFTCLLYITCCIVGVTMVVQAKSKWHLRLFQIAMLGIVFLNVLTPTLILQGTCNGLCQSPEIHDSATFRECIAKPKMRPCLQVCEIHTSIFAMTGLALFCIILEIAISSLWNGIQEKDVYANFFIEDDGKKVPRRNSGFNGMIPMFDTSINEFEDLIFEDTKESKSDPSKNDVVVNLLPEHTDGDVEEINYTGLATIVDPISSNKNKTSPGDKSTAKKDTKPPLSASPNGRNKTVQTSATNSSTKVEVGAIPKISSKGLDTAEKRKQASEILQSGTVASSPISSKDSVSVVGNKTIGGTSTKTNTVKKQIGFNIAKTPQNETDKADSIGTSKSKTEKK